MKKIRFILIFVVSTLLSFSFIYNQEGDDSLCPIEQLVEEIETSATSLFKDQEDDSAYIKGGRRNSNTNNENFSESKCAFQFTQKELLQLEKQKKAIYRTNFQLWNHDEIAYLHLFQLF